MQIQIWSDIACPWCYVGKRRFEAALSRFEHRDEVDVTWRSFELDRTAPRMHADPLPLLLARKYHVSVDRANAMNAQLAEQARAEGLELNFERVRPGNTFDAHRLLHFAGTLGARDVMVERLFRAYFTDGRAVGDRDVLVALAEEAGIDPVATRQVLAGDHFADAVRADETRARSLGISGVPFFVMDERYGVSGAQSADVILDALQQAHEASRRVLLADDALALCDDSSCAI